MTENDETTKKKKWGLALIFVPLVLWVLIALLNGFNFSRPWLGSATTDALLGIVAVILIVVGFVLRSGKKTE